MIKRRIAILISAAALITIVTIVYASQINVSNIQRMSTAEKKVEPARAEIIRVDWIIDASSSTVDGVTLIVKNTDPVNPHSFDIVVQVSCESSHHNPFICAGGSTPVGGVGPIDPGQVAPATVGFDFAIDPERTQIEDLSFIITEHPPLI